MLSSSRWSVLFAVVGIFCSATATGAKGNVYTFLHVTDVHGDDRYTVGSPAHCVEDDVLSGLGCCHKDDTASTTKPNHACSKWGDFNCDAPLFWTGAVFDWIAANVPEIDFVINTGDFASHHDITQSPWENDNTIQKITKQMVSAFPNKLLLNVLGNHDGWPVDNTVPGIYEYMLLQVSSYWSPYLGLNNATAAATLIKGGYYVTNILPDLHFIGLNILFEDNQNVFFIKEQSNLDWDPNGMWSWLNSTLTAIRKAGHKAWMGFHFGPEAGEASPNYSVRLTQYMDDFQDVIVHTFCGHTHSNQFYLYHTHDNRPVASCWAPGSLKASYHNPQFNVYRFDAETKTLIDYDHYECDLNTTIANDAVSCSLAYSFNQAYNEPDLSLGSLLHLYDKLSANSSLMQFYHHHNSPGDNYDNSDHPDSPCDAACAQGHLNDIIANVPPCPYPNVTRVDTTNANALTNRIGAIGAALQPS